jgi:hypothetical protein
LRADTFWQRRNAVAKRKRQEAEGGITRVTIRMPTALHATLLARREETGQSLNDLLIEAAAHLLGVPVPAMTKGIPGPKPGKHGRKRDGA